MINVLTALNSNRILTDEPSNARVVIPEPVVMQPGFLIKASDVEFLSPRKAEDAAQAVEDMSASEDAA